MFDFLILIFLLCLGAGIAQDVGLPLRLTPYIKSGNIEEARALSLITDLSPNITSYSGFFTVDEECDSNMFFWFFPAKNNYLENPVVLWLNGGPGSSSLFGLFTENGPYELSLDLELRLREYSWNEESSVIYLDNPVGTGFSFAKGVECFSRNQSHVAKNAVNALEQFFELFPELKENKFFLTGESYAGKYIPSIGNAIHQGPTTIKNLAGIAIGDGLIDPINQSNYSRLYYQLGLIDSKTKKEMEEVEKNIQVAIQEGNYTAAMILRNDVLLDQLFANRSGYTHFYNFLYASSPEQADYEAFITKPEVRLAIHVGNATWHRDSSDVSNALTEDIMQSAVPDLVPLLNNYKSLLYYGQMDLRDPYAPSLNFIEQLNWTGAAEYKQAARYPWKVDGEIAGYGKSASTFTELLVRNAGHMVPTDQPKWAYHMLRTFIRDESFNNPNLKTTTERQQKKKKIAGNSYYRKLFKIHKKSIRRMKTKNFARGKFYGRRFGLGPKRFNRRQSLRSSFLY